MSRTLEEYAAIRQQKWLDERDTQSATQVTIERELLERLVSGFEHVSGIARQWEPDHSSGKDRALWAKATEACADVVKVIQAAPAQPNQVLVEALKHIANDNWPDADLSAEEYAALVLAQAQAKPSVEDPRENPYFQQLALEAKSRF